MLAYEELCRIQGIGRRRNAVLGYGQYRASRSPETRASGIAQGEVHRFVALSVSIVRNRDCDPFFTFSGGEAKAPEYRRVVSTRRGRAVGGGNVNARFAGKIAKPRHRDVRGTVIRGDKVRRSV